MRKESKDVPGIGVVMLDRPNPTCRKEIGENYCGYCMWTASDKDQFVGNQWNHLLHVGSKNKTWDVIQREGAIIPAESQATLKADAINNCKRTNLCDKEIDRWRVKLDALDSIEGATR